MPRTALVPLTFPAFLALSPPALADGIVNGDFEGRGGWLVRSSEGARAPGAPAYTEGFGRGGSRGLRIGRPLGVFDLDGPRGGGAGQTFRCGGDGEEGECTVTFRARFLQRDREVAQVLMGLGPEDHEVGVGELPATPVFREFRFSTEPCGADVWVVFRITEDDAFPGEPEPTPGVQSTLVIDDVSCACGERGEVDLGGNDREGEEVLVLICFGAPCLAEPAPAEGWQFLDEAFLRGDSDGSGDVIITDPIHTLRYLFQGGPVPACRRAADSNDNGRLELTDAVLTFNFLFLGGPPLSAPFPTCGVDPTDDPLQCEMPRCP